MRGPSMLDFYGKRVICYPYRTAKVVGAYLRFDRNSREAEMIEDQLAKLAGVSKDNHTTYAIVPEKEEDGAPLFVWCSDSTMKIGTKLIEESW